MSNKLRIRVKKHWIGYPGSTVQQNYAEDKTHGYLLWELDKQKQFDVKFCELPNPCPYVTIDWKGSIDETVKEAWKHQLGCRFRIRSSELISQRDVLRLSSILKTELQATEVTFKSDHQVRSDVIMTNVSTIVKDDLRNPDVLFKLLKDYHNDNNVSDDDWLAVKDQMTIYLREALGTDDVVRNTKWSLKHMKFDNTFSYGEGNIINFEKLNGIVGIFGPNRSGKSSIVGTLMYSLFNTTDRGSLKNLHVVNVRHPYCYSKTILNVNAVDYVFERQTVKHENKKGVQFSGTALNVFKIEEDGTAVDMSGEERKDTERFVRKLIGSPEDCMLTSVATQDDVKMFINQGSSKRRKDISRFLDLDIFDRMHEHAKNDVNINKSMLRQLPERDWQGIKEKNTSRLNELTTSMSEKNVQLHDASHRLSELRSQLTSFKDVVPVTKTQVNVQETLVSSLNDKLTTAKSRLEKLLSEIDNHKQQIEKIEDVLKNNDINELRKRHELYRSLEMSVANLRVIHEKDLSTLKQQQRSLKILDDVPCGDSFPSCKFIKDAFKNKEKISSQEERVNDVSEKLKKAEDDLAELMKDDIANRVSKIEKMNDLLSQVKVSVSNKEVDVVKLQSTVSTLTGELTIATQKLNELHEALKNDENVEVVAIRNSIDDLQRKIKELDASKMSIASEIGKIRSDNEKLNDELSRRNEVLQMMRVHELIAQACSKKGIPSMIVTSQLPLINAEIAKILNGIVDFTVSLEQDDESDALEVYIDYGDSKRIIELGSGMEKMIASIAIRVALINVSSLPKSDMFIIDESFGALDPSGVEACNRLLLSLKAYFKCLIVITHVEGVKDVADHVIEVMKTEKDAKVIYNETWNGRTT